MRWLQVLAAATLLLALLQCGTARAQASVGLPIRPPVQLTQSESAPSERDGERPIAPPLLEVAPPPEVRSAGLYTPDAFPSEPRPRPNVNSEPLPLSPPGTYLHSAVLIQNRMYVYGGLSTYAGAEKSYFNDLWLFDFGESEFVQLQGNYVPPLPAQADLAMKDTSSFAPFDVPSMPNMATAPRNDRVAVEKLHPDANPISPFLPRARAQRPVRVVALEHIYEKDKDKPTAAGIKASEIYAQAAKAQAQAAAKAKKAEAPAAAFIQSEEHLSLHHKARSRFLHRTLESIRAHAAPQRAYAANAFPGSNAGTPYADERHFRDGSASEHYRNGQRIQDGAFQKQYAHTASPTSAPSDARETVPHGRQDFWCYDLDTYTWALVNVTSSQPLAHSPWLTPKDLNDPVFKDPLPILLPPSRRLHTAVVMKDRMIIFGGVSYNNLILGDIWIFDPAEGSWIEASADGPGGSPILPREGHTAVTLKDDLTMLVFGGVSYGFLPFNDLWSYSAVDNAWTRLSSSNDQTLPMQRWLHTAIYHAPTDSMVVFGGVTAHYVPLNDVHVYDVAAASWRAAHTTGTPPFPRMMHTAVVMKDLMLVTGGAANNLPMDDMFVLDLHSWEWRELLQTSAYPFARTGATAILLSPAHRAQEVGQEPDSSPDASDPHLRWFADRNALAARPIVGSFSTEGVADRSEQEGNMEGLDAIAFPHAPVVHDDNTPRTATPRPLYRYRKHAQNDFYMLLFGGAAASSAPQQELTNVQKGDTTADD